MADLTMVLLGFFVILHAAGPRVAAGAMRSAFGSNAASPILMDEAAGRLFDPEEARLKPGARERLRRLAVAAPKGTLVVESFGRSPASRRLDGWELAAARTAAVAHALQDAGISEKRISVVMPDTDSGGAEKSQRIVVRRL